MTDSASSPDHTDPDVHPSQISKVARLLANYNLTEMGKLLEKAWTHPDEPVSLRDLAIRFNQRLLKEAMTGAGLNPLDGELENTYRLLTDDDVSPGDATEARRRLERAGIDIDQLTTDFVSRQAIHTYLTTVRGVTHQSTDAEPLENAKAFLRHLKQQTTTIIDSRLSQLHDAGHLSIGSPRILLEIHVLCDDCGQQYSLPELLTAGSCACEASDNP